MTMKDKVKKKINSLFFPLGPAFIFLFFYIISNSKFSTCSSSVFANNLKPCFCFN